MRRISQMQWGESGWAVPWALYHNTHDELCLNGRHLFFSKQTTEHCMKVKRGKATYTADISQCDPWVRPENEKVGGVVEHQVTCLIE